MLLVGLVVFASIYLFFVTPAYVIAQRTGSDQPWVALVPWFGVWIVLLESMRRNAWFSLLAFLPYLGAVLLFVWVSAELPSRHGRSNAWIVPFFVPGVNLVAYWVYALTLPHRTNRLVLAA